jgi:hypothetical protein
MSKHAGEKGRALSPRVYAALLAAYPSEFRRDYGREMALVFADRCRETAGRGGSLRVWREALCDLARAAMREHVERLRQGGGLMKTVRTIVMALLAYAFTLLVVAPLYARNAGRVPAFVASLADALIFTGLVFNFIFLVLTLPRWLEGVRAVRASLVLTAGLIAVLLAVMMVKGGPPARVNVSIVAAQVLSLLVWFSLYLWWVRRKATAGPPATA